MRSIQISITRSSTSVRHFVYFVDHFVKKFERQYGNISNFDAIDDIRLQVLHYLSLRWLKKNEQLFRFLKTLKCRYILYIAYNLTHSAQIHVFGATTLSFINASSFMDIWQRLIRANNCFKGRDHRDRNWCIYLLRYTHEDAVVCIQVILYRTTILDPTTKEIYQHTSELYTTLPK